MAKFAKVEAYRCTNGKILTPKPKETIARFKERVKEYEYISQIAKALTSILPTRPTLREIAESRKDIQVTFNEKYYDVNI